MARRTIAIVAAAVMPAAGAAGCGEDDFPNRPRPPAVIVVSAAISGRGVSVSPARFGAGRVNLVITNQTGASHQITLRSRDIADGSEPLDQRTGPINPSDTASLTADLVEGTYLLSVGNRSVKPAVIDVGRRRESAQHRLLQP